MKTVEIKQEDFNILWASVAPSARSMDGIVIGNHMFTATKRDIDQNTIEFLQRIKVSQETIDLVKNSSKGDK